MTPSDRPREGARNRAIARFAAAPCTDASATETPEDAAALRQVSEVWRDLDGVAEHPAVKAMREQALARLGAQASVETAEASRWRVPVMASLAATLVAVVALGLIWRPAQTVTPVDDGQVIANGQSLPRDVDLADGTRITLDSHTQLHVSRDGRLARLDYGRAFFNVHHDEAHPFAVKVGDMVVSDIGTHFEIGQAGETTTVTLVEGKVRVTRVGLSIDLTPGNQLRLSHGHQIIATLDAGRQTLWESGMISADDVPVSQIVDQYNRYLAHPMRLKEPAMGSLRISGEFRLDDPQGFLDAVAAINVHNSGTVRPLR